MKTNNSNNQSIISNYILGSVEWLAPFIRYFKENTFKKGVSLFFLLTLIAPIFINFYLYNGSLNTVQEKVAEKIDEGIEKNELVFLSFTRQETETKLRWEHSKEFEYNGQMYDIVETIEQKDSVFYWAWWDKEESKLKKEYRETIASLLNQQDENAIKAGDNNSKKSLTVYNNSQQFSFEIQSLKVGYISTPQQILYGYLTTVPHPPNAI